MSEINYDELERGKGVDQLLYRKGEKSPYTGIASSWYKNGKLKFRGSYQDGILHGKATWWDRNGRKEFETVYVEGKAQGCSTDS